MTQEKERIKALADREGVFGFGLSNNNNLDLLNLVVLACAGIIIKIFFQANIDETAGHVGPASTTIWGYGITAFALFIMTFMSFYMSNRNDQFHCHPMLLNFTRCYSTCHSIPLKFHSKCVCFFPVKCLFMCFTQMCSSLSEIE